jgi:hypothetical protein
MQLKHFHEDEASAVQGLLEQDSDDEAIGEFGEDPIEKMKQWKLRKNIPTANTRSVPDRCSPSSPIATFSPWTKNQMQFKVPEPEQLEEGDLELLAERNYECLLDYDDQAISKQKLTYWEQSRIKEEEEIKKINFESFMIR